MKYKFLILIKNAGAAFFILPLLFCTLLHASDESKNRDIVTIPISAKEDTRHTNEVLIVRGDHNYPPYEYINEQGRPDGFNVDIANGVAKAMGLQISIDLGPWDRVTAQLEQGEIDALIGMLKMLLRLIGEDIELAWLPGRNLGTVKIDPTQIDQILVNLCINARDAVSSSGKISIETDKATIDTTYCNPHMDFSPGKYILLAVHDNGEGIAPENLTHLFEPFFTTKGLGEGTGLGLATVYGIVKQNNGFIDVDTKKHQGTVFKIYLPRYAATAEPVELTKDEEIIATGSETILLVEDESMILNLTRMMLEGLGYAILPAGTPGEAIQLAQEHSAEIHLLVTDVVMPEMNGRDLAEKLLSLYPEMKGLYMSGYPADVIAHHGILDENVHFIQKPFTLNELADKVRSTLDEESSHTI